MRLIIVSNRLPVTIKQVQSQLTITPSVGGLSNGIFSYLAHPKKHPQITQHLWVGWPGSSYSDQHTQDRITQKLQSQQLLPVFLSPPEYRNYYLGFCNQTLWPLFHAFTDFVKITPAWWQAYQNVNQRYANQINRIIKPGDIVWVHDYQLMLLPKLIKQTHPKIPVGFFLHIPFPSANIFNQLSRSIGESLIKGIQASEVVGFHIPEYLKNYQDINNIWGISSPTSPQVYPISIDTEKYAQALQLPAVKKHFAKLQKKFNGQHLILSVDRLDYTKAIAERLKGYELFLNQNQQLHRGVSLALLIAPSRENIPAYRQTKQEIDQLVESINRKYSTENWQPIFYSYKETLFEELNAYYNLSDAILVTPTKDGMNLIAKEYVMSRVDKQGLLILSRHAGAAHELKQALLINPNPQEIADALKQSITMPTAEKITRNAQMQAYLSDHTIIDWANKFITDLTQKSD